MIKGISEEELNNAESGAYLTLDSAFCLVKQAVRILGSDNNSKTSALIERVITLLDSGVRPADIRIICASSVACLDLKEGLRRRLDPGKADALEEMETTTTRDLSLRVLSRPEAQAATGRRFNNNNARLLAAYEMDFMLEDLKTLGTRPDRLRELLKFLLRGLTELADEGGGWLLFKEEQEMLGFLRSELRFLQGVIEPELSNLASKALRANGTLKACFAKPHIFVSDYQNLSRASQLLCHVLATDSITVSADPSWSVETYDSYPYAAGVEEFLKINVGAETFVIEKKEPPFTVDTWSWEIPTQEIAKVPDLVKEMVSEGEAPEQIALVCFHPQWYNKIICGLRARGLTARGLYQPLTLKGDIRFLARSLPLRIVTALRLLAEPNDSMAWRCWVGFGDHLTKSNAFVKAREEAEANNPDAVFADIVTQWEDWEPSTSFFKDCADMRGRELLEFLAEELSVTQEPKLPPLLVSLLSLGTDATPDKMLALLDEKQFFPCFFSTEGVAVVSLDMLAGLSFDRVIAVGFVNGFFPLRSYFDLVEATIKKQKNIEEQEKKRLSMFRAAVADKLVLSHFNKVEQKTSDEWQLKPDRIIVDEDMRRICIFSISVFAKDLP